MQQTPQFAHADKSLYHISESFFAIFRMSRNSPTQKLTYTNMLNLRDDTFALGFHRMDRVVTVILIVGINAAATDPQGVAR